jgi:hypothetical protein
VSAPPGARASFTASERTTHCCACIVALLALASGLLAASSMALSRQLLDRHARAARNKYDCRVARDTVSDWGEHLAFEAASLGSLIISATRAAD